MLEPETKTRLLQNPSTSSPSAAAALLLAFKPRQVVLAESSKSNLVMAKKEQNQENTFGLQQSILHYLNLNGFSKTLKYFLKETQTESDSWKSCSLSLEDLYSKYLKNSTDNDTISKGDKEPVLCQDGMKGKNISSNDADSQEKVSKNKKKKRSEDNDIAVPDASHPESVDKSMKNGATAQEVLADDKADVPLRKQKEKKKKKTEEKPENVDPIDNDNNDLTVETTKKDKKKKSKEKSGATDSKDSNKRKRLASDENANQGVDGVETEESKRRKTEDLEESKALCTDNGIEQNGEVVEANSSGNNQDELNNSAKQKSSRKDFYGSAEPKTVNAFQRVKIDQVEFKDDRLKDNSYWAKDGADIGYGAKAQEVLGQVKGRDFRHEKTKKKRGSYRGGIIDLQSHSVKFNYSDEE
ncbi:suppressor protein SRP40 [Solanum verrucosum]|uniref:suppressor protein SRP40 n=1 Tax=Solanum verrucosum TaxID=315347 RepID=UPI0020D0F23D|nr:suppressor protein SRP40 [Solanum verrucosum]XP_049359968.1 suppressor protein SRP40 [Solanum verrucosum]